MTTIGILGAGEVGGVLARASIAAGYDVVLANSRGPETLRGLVRELGPHARAGTAAEAADAGDFAFLAYPWAPSDRLPVDELAGKVVLDNNNFMAWRDGRFPDIESGRVTVHELRQAQLPDSFVVKAFSHVQFHARSPLRVPSDALPGAVRLARPPGAPDRRALVVAGDAREATRLAARFTDDLGFDAVDDGPLRDSWRSAPGTPMWRHIVDGQSHEQLVRTLRAAVRPGG